MVCDSTGMSLSVGGCSVVRSEMIEGRTDLEDAKDDGVCGVSFVVVDCCCTDGGVVFAFDSGRGDKREVRPFDRERRTEEDNGSGVRRALRVLERGNGVLDLSDCVSCCWLVWVGLVGLGLVKFRKICCTDRWASGGALDDMS